MTDTGVDANATLAVIAAAGRGRRFGADKRRAPWPTAAPACHHPGAGRRPLSRVAVVIRADDDPAELGLGDALVLRAPRAERGLGASIGDAFAALLAADEAARVAALWLGDMPWVGDATVAALRAGPAPTASFARCSTARRAFRCCSAVPSGRSWPPAPTAMAPGI
ncbi:NTP transferase domain-containing protein [Alcanivorax sp. IO_7]|nr:NTP transferase domain-containing protein [Alcanivorax sp. IO_7]